MLHRSKNKTQPSEITFLSRTVLVLCSFLIMQCGALSGGDGTLNESEPSGTIVAQGSFTGSDYTGIAKVYLQSSGVNILRLEGFSATSTSGVFLVALTNSTTALTSVLRGTSGNQNYTTSVNGSATWTSIQIEDTIGNTLSAATMQNF